MRHEQEFAEFVATRSPALLRFATLLTGDRAAGEEMLHRALVRTYEGWGRVEDPDAHVRRTMVDHAGGRLRGRRGSVPGPRGGGGAAQDDALLSAVARLPMKARACVILRYHEHRDEAEIAQVLGLSPAAVRHQLARATEALRQNLTLEGVTR